MKTRRFVTKALGIIGAGLVLPGGVGAATGLDLHVAPDGDDAADGSAARPLRTLTGARDRLRTLRRGGVSAPCCVSLHSGTYFINEPFQLTAEDSGTAQAPVTYRALPGAEVRLFGGVRLSAQSARRIDDINLLARVRPQVRGNLVAFDFAAAGVNLPPALPPVFEDNGGLFSVIHKGEKLPQSRWPKGGYTTIAEVLDSGIAPPRGGTFRYRGDHPATWAAAVKKGELWLTGFWRVPFSVQSVKVASLDTAARTITLAAPVSLGIGSKYTPLINGTRKGDGKEPYYAFNLPEEIEAPGEWCYDYAGRRLLIWLPEPSASLEVTTLNTPMIHLSGVSHVRFSGFEIAGGRAGAMRIDGGWEIALEALRLRNIGGGAIDMVGGFGHSVRGCDLEHIGRFAVRVTCGDRKTLTPGDVVIENNHIRNFGEEARISPAIALNGVGNRVRNNLIHDGPNAGIVYQGNDLLIERNEIHHIGLDSGDLGGIYTNGDWAGLGNIVRHNFIHSSAGANGVYIDDGASGHRVEGNICFRLASGPFIGGGHGNQIIGNLVMACRLGLHLDDRGVSRNYGLHSSHLGRLFNQLNTAEPPWSSRYGEVLNTLKMSPQLPTGNVLEKNILINTQKPFDLARSVTIDTASNAVFDRDPGLTNPADFDLSPAVKTRAVAGLSPLAAIPFDRIGLYVDALRKALPPDLQQSRHALRQGRILFDSQTDIEASNR
ncbi:right-handed parallel beta-helix repeat-containing protein [Asticcacaulis sp. DXS10W]|uniref:Right-handed parallel beta-helix repeat-containing protein n=1 Tax=Asticcacaulis currens TaxID=2984210 RepID=A0ABT5IBY2_9CAUL|nr:right-handed parallel beta-helix repeat-containing protein [Asticcacaulis currens]MDC7693697.1 right-handed parallel beta-helix repeat-containing protein [Asticcacaulis currens]